MRRIHVGLLCAAMLAAVSGGVAGILKGADTAPAQSIPAASAPADEAAKKPTVEDLLSKKKVAVDLEQKTVPEVLDFLATSYGVRVTARPKEELPPEKITLKPDQPMAAREAINTVNDMLMVLGYTLVETVQGDPPEVVVTVVPTKRVNDLTTREGGHGQFQVPVYFGNDPSKIPVEDDIRTQVFTLTHVDPAKAKETIASVLDARADVTLNPAMNTMIVTDSGAHVHTAAALLEVLEKQAAAEKDAAGGAK